jgi:phenylacetate-coenzyme A ligase PaaK-like adenylate-forming protein
MKTFRPDYSLDYLDRCREVLDCALGEIPAYRSWAARDPGGTDPLQRLAALPLVDKALMRRLGPSAFADPRCGLEAALARGEVELVHTSGSTGDRVSNVWCQTWWNASEEASWQLNAHARRLCDRIHPEAILASPLCVGFPSEEAYLERGRRTLGRFLFLNERMNPCGWTPAHMDRMLQELNAFKPAVLEASPSYLAHLCRHAAAEKRSVQSPGLIVLTFENPSLLHRRQIRTVFDSPIASSYGATEAGYVFMECECGRLHQNTAFCHVDFIPYAPEHGGPETGAILVTTFHNPWRVLLRFDIGDVVQLAREPCPCGRREGLTLSSIEGRAANITVTPEGRAVTQNAVDRAVGTVVGLEDYQLEQTAPGDYRFRFVCPDGDEKETVGEVLEALVFLYGKGARIGLERVGALPPDPPGKCRLCKPAIPVDPRAFWDPVFSRLM